MSTVDTLLDEELNNGYTVLTIDEPTRSIQYDGDLILGVEGDKYAERIYFVAPKIVGDDIDLSASTTRIDVKFTNGYGESYYIQSTDIKAQEDGNVTFSWLLTEKVAVTYGNVPFTVCVKQMDSTNTVEKEWHTAPYVGKVIKGVDATLEDVEIITDITCPTYEMLQEFNEFNTKLDDFWDEVANKSNLNHVHDVATSSQNGFMSASDKRSVLQSASDIVTLQNNVTAINADIASLNKAQENFEVSLDSFKGVATQFQLLKHQNMCKTADGESDIEENTTGYLDLSSYMRGYNELMIVLRFGIKSGGTSEYVGISETKLHSGALASIQVSSAQTYNVINVCKTSDGYYAWTIDGKFNWATNTFKYLYHSDGGSGGEYFITVKVYGR